MQPLARSICSRRGSRAVAVAAWLALAALAPGAEKRLVTLDDLAALRDVGDPRISPDGAWVAYTVRTIDTREDKRSTDLFMTSWDGARTVRLTWTPKESEHDPRFSPEGRYLAFLSSRTAENEVDQVWILNRAGGEAEKVTDLKGGVEAYEWSPDGRRMALVVKDPDPDAEDATKKEEKKPPKPIVIDRFQFKLDDEGYLRTLRKHLYLFDLATRKAEILTPGEHDDVLPAWSPDGASIAFVSKRGPDPDRHSNFDLYVVEARPGATARPLTTYDGADCDPDWESPPAFSPDGKSIAYLEGGPKELIYYAVNHLAVIPSAGGTRRILGAALDRNVSRPRFSPDGRSIYFLLEDDRVVRLARIPAGGGPIDVGPSGRSEAGAFDVSEAGIAFLLGTPEAPFEVFVLDRSERSLAGAQARPLSRQNEELLSKLRLARAEEIEFGSKDGTQIHGFLVKPPDSDGARRVPTLLRIHGGPTAQFTNRFMFDWQLFAARGYAVVAANPRGSTGRGPEFEKAIWADWGNRDAQDVLAAVDHAVALGVADRERLGIGGWSYGGMLTNYVIAQDSRFKAATSGASISNVLAGYGTDMYIREYEAELGTPWRNLEGWLHVSFPFVHADRITTPTLFLCGEKDFNVPLLNSEQMYQALRSLGRDTRLVIYPGQFHEIRRPSHQRDRLERYLAWYDTYLAPGPRADRSRGPDR